MYPKKQGLLVCWISLAQDNSVYLDKFTLILEQIIYAQAK